MRRYVVTAWKQVTLEFTNQETGEKRLEHNTQPARGHWIGPGQRTCLNLVKPSRSDNPAYRDFLNPTPEHRFALHRNTSRRLARKVIKRMSKPAGIAQRRLADRLKRDGRPRIPPFPAQAEAIS